MRVLVVAIVTMLPTMAIAQDRIPDNLLRQHNESCVAKCSESRSYAFCAETCACMVGEMERHWTAKDFQDRSKKLSKSDDDRTVQKELGRIADYCAERTMRSAQQ